ncbi:MAG: hypothetical protein U1E80_05725 [Piscinibacter sp.]
MSTSELARLIKVPAWAACAARGQSRGRRIGMAQRTPVRLLPGVEPSHVGTGGGAHGTHQQTRRCVPANAADPRRTHLVRTAPIAVDRQDAERRPFNVVAPRSLAGPHHVGDGRARTQYDELAIRATRQGGKHRRGVGIKESNGTNCLNECACGDETMA